MPSTFREWPKADAPIPQTQERAFETIAVKENVRDRRFVGVSELGEPRVEFPVLLGVIRERLSRARQAPLDGPRLCDNAVLGMERLLELLCPDCWRSCENVLRQLLDPRRFDGWKEPVARVLVEGHNVEQTINLLSDAGAVLASINIACRKLSFVLRVTLRLLVAHVLQKNITVSSFMLQCRRNQSIEI